MSEPVVDLLEEEFAALLALSAQLAHADWEAPTQCPGWSVRDQFAHVIGTERSLLGEPVPSGTDDAARAPHVRNAIGEFNERWIASYRSVPVGTLVEDLRDVTARRLEALRAMSEAELDVPGWTPKGQAPYREFMAIRVFDCWTHEQDIRRAAGMPGHMDGPVAAHCRERLFDALPYVVAKKVGSPDGTVVAVVVEGVEGREAFVEVAGGRGTFMAGDNPRRADPDVTMVTDLETLACLGCGRWDPEDVLATARGTLRVEGDRALGNAVVRNMNFMI